MASVVSICNLALSHIRAASIASLTEASAEASACTVHYEQSRDSLLAMYPWDFAGEFAVLAEEANDWTERYERRFRLPNDVLKVRRIVPGGSDPLYGREFTVPYSLRAGRLYASTETVTLEYTMRVTDPTLFPPLFVDALAWHLASRIARPITGDRQIMGDALTQAQSAFLVASAHDANNSINALDYVGESILARA